MTRRRGAGRKLGTTPILVYVRRHRYMHWHGEESRETRVGAGRSARTHSYVSDARKAHASLGDTVTTVSVIPTGPGAAGVISPNFFLFVTTIGVIVS